MGDSNINTDISETHVQISSKYNVSSDILDTLIKNYAKRFFTESECANISELVNLGFAVGVDSFDANQMIFTNTDKSKEIVEDFYYKLKKNIMRKHNSEQTTAWLATKGDKPKTITVYKGLIEVV